MTRLTHHFGTLRQLVRGEVVLGNVVLAKVDETRQRMWIPPVVEKLRQVIREIAEMRPLLARACRMLELGMDGLVSKLRTVGEEARPGESETGPG